MPARTPTYDLSLLPAQQRIVAALLACLTLATAWRWTCRAVAADEASLPVLPDRVARVAQRVNPNSAGLAELVRLRGIGIKRAGEIIAYRDRLGPNAFRQAKDLQEVRGIGPRTLQAISPWLVFDETPDQAGARR
jgi:competence ComEA-like helix-hairpin-helix protein